MIPVLVHSYCILVRVEVPTESLIPQATAHHTHPSALFDQETYPSIDMDDHLLRESCLVHWQEIVD